MAATRLELRLSLNPRPCAQVSVGRYHIGAVTTEGELFTWSLITGSGGGDDVHIGLGHGSATAQVHE